MRQNKSTLVPSLILAVLLFTASAISTWPPPASAEGNEAYALQGGTIVTVTGGVIQKGTIVIRNGLIEAVGADISIPGDARIIDTSGLTIYPGLFDSYTNLGLTQSSPTGMGGAPTGSGRTFQQAPPAPAESGLLPEIEVTSLLQTGPGTFDSQRAAGITTALTGPASGIFQGRSALINLGADSAEKLIIRTPFSLNVGFSSARGGYPNSLMGVFAFLRQSLLDAQHYREEWSRYRNAPRGVSRPEINRSLEALQPVINGELPVIFTVNTVREMKRAIALAEEFNLKFILNGGLQSYQIADYLKSKRATILLSLSLPQRPAGLEDPESESLRTLRERAAAPATAATLHKAGVTFAFSSGNLSRPADYLINAQRAIQAGLPKEAALQALTIIPATIFGVNQQLGSIEKGKIANLVLATGDIFAPGTIIKHVFVDGKRFDIKAPESPRPAGPAGRPGGRGRSAETTEAALAGGVWSMTLQTPGNEVSSTMSLQQNGDSVTGEVTTPFGTARISQGRIRGNTLTLGYTLNFQGQEVPIEARGQIDGNSIRGTMSAMGQSFSFTGTRRPN
jgi:imidazolonepropionase-like amidohydrolase